MTKSGVRGVPAPTASDWGHVSIGGVTADASRQFASGSWCALIALAVAVTGCATVGPEFETPAAPVAESWQESDSSQLKRDSAEHREWWKVFNDPVLDAVVDSAYRQNLDLRIAGLRVLEARAQLGIAVGNLYPQQQQATADATYYRASENAANTVVGDLRYTDFSVGFDAAWELDFWGRFRRGIQSADAAFLSSIADYDVFLVTLTAEAANTYALIRTFEERVQIANDNVAIQQRSVEIADVRFRAGATTELDVQQAKSLLFNTKASIPQLESGLRAAENALGTLLGMPPGQVRALLGPRGAIPAPASEVAVGIPAELLRRRPDVRRAELQAAAQSALIGVAKADLYPSFSLFGSIGLLAASGADRTRTGNSGIDELFDSDSLFFVGGPSVNWPIFNYGRIKNNVRVQDARYQELAVNYQNTVLRAAQEAEDAMTRFLRSQEEVGYRADGEHAARRAVDLALIQYREGATDYTTVLNTQTALATQQDQLTAARGSVAQALVALYKALGGGWQLREGQEFVPEQTKTEMRERTDWGGLLDPAALEPAPDEGGGTKHKIDW